MKKLLPLLITAILICTTACSNDMAKAVEPSDNSVNSNASSTVSNNKTEREIVKSVMGINLPNGTFQDLMQIPNKDLEGSTQMFGGILTWKLFEYGEDLGLNIPYGLGESLCLSMEDHKWNYYEYDDGTSKVEFIAELSNTGNMRIEFSSVSDDLKSISYYSEMPFDITGIYINNEPIPNWKTIEFLTAIYLSGAY